MSKSVKLTTPNQETLELPVLEASIGHDVVDIRTLTKNTGLFSFDPDSFQLQVANLKSLILMAMKVCCITVVILSSSWPKNLITWKFATC